MKKIVSALIVVLVVSLLSFIPQNSEVRVGYIYDDVELSLDHEMTASLEDFATKYELDKVFVSEEFYGDFSFNAVALEWYEEVPESTSSEFFIHFLADGEWSEWVALDKDTESRGDDYQTAYSFVMTNTAEAFQYKVVMHSEDAYATPYLRDIEFQYIDTVSSYRKPLLNLNLNKIIFNGGDVDIISRSEWGADESYRIYGGDEEDLDDDDGLSSAIESEIWEGVYDSELEIDETVTHEDGERLSWALEYPEDVDKIIIHHTATTTDLDDPEAAVQAIYYYHAISRGWSDIGYNYIIDQYGNIYEGRAGGEGVAAGHAAGYNVGSVGIAVLGNYENGPMTYESTVSLMSLIEYVADDFGIDVSGSSKFRGEVIPNLLGHSDVGATACPGDYIYDMLPNMRSAVDSSLYVFAYDEDDEYAYETVTDWEPVYMSPEDEVVVTFEIENIGTETWDEDTFLVANEDWDGEQIVNLNRAIDDSIAPMNEYAIHPGEVASFDVTLSSHILGGFVNFDITPIFNGYKKTSNYMSLPVYVEAPDLSYEVLDIDLESGDWETWRLESEESMDIGITLENTGNITWKNDGDYPTYLTGDDLFDEVLMNEDEVEPGETASFEFTVTGPQQAGNYTEEFVLTFGDIGEGETSDDNWFELLIYNTSQQAEYMGGSDKIEFYPGEEEEVWIELLNTGYQDWTDDELTVGFVKYTDIEVEDYYLVETLVEPGETGKIKFTVTAPSALGDYKIYIKPRINGRNLYQGNFYYEFSVVEGDDSSYDEPDVRVALSYDGDEPVITADGNFGMYSNDKLIRNFTEDDSVEISFDGLNYQIKSGGFAWVLDAYPVFVPSSSAVIMEIEDFENRPAWNEELNDNRYRGSLEIRNMDGAMVIINELGLEDYVKGVAEVSNSDPEEKLKTMSILARTYALYYIEIDDKFPGFPYDLNDDPDYCQKYLGYGYEERSPNMADAVTETDGMVVTYDDELVKTPYFNSTDGTATKSAEEVWGWTDTPWLVSVEDPLCDGDAFSGHGVGLSGCGAEAAAENGSTYDEIIYYYYTDVEITHISEL